MSALNDPSVLISMFTFLGLVVVAVQNIVLHVRQTGISDKQTAIVAKQDAIAENVQKIETASNSMKDALVASTAKASFAEGAASQRTPSARAQGFAAGEASRKTP